ncbi:hypothetical protein L6R52_33330, partial [Myxococcota bacterium]|nr:hypothetical protein [Myxococcota bacterium]
GAARPRAPAAPARAAGLAEVPLGPSLFLSKSGNLVPEAGLDRTRNAQELGDTLFKASMRAEDGENLFRSPAITVEQKSLALTSLVAAFNSANLDMPAVGGWRNKEQALQVRSTVAPLVLDLAESLSSKKPAEAELQKKAVEQYLKLLESEPHGLNRNFMIFDLDQTKAKLPAQFHAVIDGLMKEVAPEKPFYDEWFANGNTKLAVDYHVGKGFWEEEVQFWVAKGYEKRDNGDGTLTLSKRLEVNGVATDVEMRMYDGPDAMFRKMNDPKVHLVVYSGHANYGRHVSSRLPNGTPQLGNKVFFGLQCGGKGVHNMLLEKYPELQVVQSKNSSYPDEDRYTLENALNGIAARTTWTEISKKNSRENSDNYYFPTDTLVKKRAEDRDGDGIVDAWDRVVNYNMFHPQASIDQEFVAKDPGRAADTLDGRAIEGALARFLRIVSYNEWAEHLKDQRVLTHGFYEGTPQDPLFKVTKERDAEGPLFKVEVNKCFAQMSEESLGAAMHYELGRQECERQGLPPTDAKAAALLMVAKCLDVDQGQMDQQIWRAMVTWAGLPATVTYQDAIDSAKLDKDMGAGTRETLAAYKQKLAAKGIQL